MRLYDTYDMNYTMWGEELDNEDMDQGSIGNCWFIVASAGVADVPDRIKNIFLTEQRNPYGIYALQMYALGVPVTLTIDDQIPVDNKTHQTIFAHIRPSEKAIWPTLIEKAFAKYYGNYDRIVAGNPVWAIEVLTGSPGYEINNDQNTSKDEVWAQLQAAKAAGDIITMGTKELQGQEAESATAVGLASSHAYNVVDVVTTSKGDRLIKVRNPWASERYHGPFSDESEQMTDELRAELGHTSVDDGYFYIDLDTYYDEVGFTGYNKNIAGKTHTTFTVRGDENSGNADQLPSSFGGWTARGFKVSSEVEQLVTVGVYTWEDRSYPVKDECAAW